MGNRKEIVEMAVENVSSSGNNTGLYALGAGAAAGVATGAAA